MTTPQAQPTQPQTLTARSPEDLLAVVPVVLGFEPHDSVVMLTVGGPQTLHARIDLPRDDADIDQVVECLVRPAVRHRADGTVFLLYTADDALARRVTGRLRRRMRRLPLRLVDAIRVADARWYPLTRDRNGLGATGVPYDVSSHPFVAAAVLEGRVLHRSRAELAATLRPVPEHVAAVEAARHDGPRSAAWIEELLAEHLTAGTVPDHDDTASLLESVADPAVRDRIWPGIRRDTARRDVRLWTRLVQCAPEDLVAHPASVLGLAAWVAGDGALAWCAVDRAREADPAHSLAGLVASMLEGAVAPTEWDRTAARLGSAS